MSELRSGVILFHDGRLAVHHDGALPSAPVAPGGDPAATAVAAARDRLGCETGVEPEPSLEVRAADGTHLYYRATADHAGRARLLTREEALHLSLTPWVAGEAILRTWSHTPPWHGRLVLDDPYGEPPKRTRAGAVVIRGGRVLLIEHRNRPTPVYEIPGGGVEAGETPQDAVLRELTEETGLSGTVIREIAQVARMHRGAYPGHYFLVEAEGVIGAPGTLDLDDGERPVWIPVADLPGIPLWPKRLGWRIAHWHRHGWPDEPVVLSDSVKDLFLPCDW